MDPIFGHGSKNRAASPNYDMNRQVHDSWINCNVCGFTIPTGEAVVHYRKGKLVCTQCDDQMTNVDLQPSANRPLQERIQNSPQRVND